MKPLKLSAIAILSVFIVEVSLGFIVGSLAILSDGLHALFDALTTFGLFIATRASLKPPDEEHMYGHEKIESIGGLIGGIVLVGLALLIMFEAFLKVVQNRPYITPGLELAGFISIGYTFCIDFFRVGTFSKTRKSKSHTIEAGFYHSVADLGSTVIALLGFGLATLGFYQGDYLASIILGFLLIYLSVKLVWSSGMELSDAISKDVVKKIQSEIASAKGACQCENMKIRKSGEKFFIEATLKVPDYISLEEAHEITAKIEENIRSKLGNAETTFHIEPIGTQEIPTKKLVEKLVTEVEGVNEAHEIDTVYTKGKLYITLHARVKPELSIQEAHEIAEKIEERIREKIEDIEHITVHVEPFDTELRKGAAVDEEEIKRIIYKTAENYRQAFRVKRIVTYVADKKRYINIDCCFTKQVSIEDAHKIASQIEDTLEKKLVETMVTVHMEPDST